MQVIINNSGDLNEGTRQVILEKIKKLETYYDRIEKAEVFLKEDDGSAANGHTVEARLSIPGNDLFADFTDPSMERAVDRVAEALRKQIAKHKTKINDRNQAAAIPPMGENDDVDRIVRSEEELRS